jgi:hypothetical protein
VVDEQEFRVEVEHGRQIESELVWLDDAKDKYDDALASGHSAYLLSTPGAPRGTYAGSSLHSVAKLLISYDRCDAGEHVFSVSVGLLLPRKEVVIRLRYISALTVDLGMARTTLFAGPHHLTVRLTHLHSARPYAACGTWIASLFCLLHCLCQLQYVRLVTISSGESID